MPFIVILCLLFTLPAAADPTRIAFGSCARIDLPQPIWNAITAWHPDAFISLGDIIYADTEDMTQMRAMYAQMDTVTSFKRLRQNCPLYAIWDDHDYGENDGGETYPKRDDAQTIFLDFLNEPATSPRRTTPGIYDAFYLDNAQRIQLILLDTRYFRSNWVADQVSGMRYRPVYDSDRTMLGDTQWAWLKDQLQKPADVRLIASGIQIVNDEHGYECWGLFPLERDRLFKLIKNTNATGVLFLSGDRHFAEISAIDGGVGYPLYDFTASGLTHVAIDGMKAPNNKRVGAAFGDFNFGTVTIDLNATDPFLRLQIHDVNGTTKVSHRIPLADLK